ncbi:fumarate hydratase subunit alpha [Desulfitispora alkaliphila]|uniref:fumarate hydratase n=1 Tax=Desulfitispora alkaliphila TaxID=622674 RepID=UPI003D1B9C10
MKTIAYDTIVDTVAQLCIKANTDLDQSVVDAFQSSLENEESSVGKEILAKLIQNAKIAETEKVAMCQDTGAAVVFIDMGQDVKIEGGALKDAITEGVRQGYDKGYLRKSMCHPFTRKNTGDNTPAIVHTNIVPGDNLKISVAPKGGGSENMSTLKMLTPAQGKQGVIDFVVESVDKAGPNPCPPLVVGVGIGGNFERCAYLAKKALLKPLDSENGDAELKEMEAEIQERINKLGIGPQGFGGRTTALRVLIEMEPCHIASFPVAVNINCHAARHAEAVL